MGKNLFLKVSEMIAKIKLENREITKDELKTFVIREIGSDDRTLKRVISTINQLNMMEETDGKIRFK